MNYVVRFKNPTFLVTFAAAVVAFIYQMLGMFEVVPTISESDVINIISIVINVLTMLGIFVDPTTKGISDSANAMTYIEPM